VLEHRLRRFATHIDPLTGTWADRDGGAVSDLLRSHSRRIQKYPHCDEDGNESGESGKTDKCSINRSSFQIPDKPPYAATGQQLLNLEFLANLQFISFQNSESEKSIAAGVGLQGADSNTSGGQILMRRS
jgi:hypothetical protein